MSKDMVQVDATSAVATLPGEEDAADVRGVDRVAAPRPVTRSPTVGVEMRPKHLNLRRCFRARR